MWVKGGGRAGWSRDGEQKGDVAVKKEEQKAREGLWKGSLHEVKGCLMKGNSHWGTIGKTWGTATAMQ